MFEVDMEAILYTVTKKGNLDEMIWNRSLNEMRRNGTTR